LVNKSLSVRCFKAKSRPNVGEKPKMDKIKAFRGNIPKSSLIVSTILQFIPNLLSQEIMVAQSQHDKRHPIAVFIQFSRIFVHLFICFLKLLSKVMILP